MRDGKRKRHENGVEEEEEGRGGVLRTLLLGPPLNCRRPCIDEVDSMLTEHLDGVPDVMRRTYGDDTEATREAIKDVQRISALRPSREGICCKRAALLFAMKREPEVQKHFLDRDPDLAFDLMDRVLPLLDPCFVKHSCQCPESYVCLAVVLTQMFAGERVGNWPVRTERERTTTAPLGC